MTAPTPAKIKKKSKIKWGKKKEFRLKMSFPPFLVETGQTAEPGGSVCLTEPSAKKL